MIADSGKVVVTGAIGAPGKQRPEFTEHVTTLTSEDDGSCTLSVRLPSWFFDPCCGDAGWDQKLIYQYLASFLAYMRSYCSDPAPWKEQQEMFEGMLRRRSAELEKGQSVKVPNE